MRRHRRHDAVLRRRRRRRDWRRRPELRQPHHPEAPKRVHMRAVRLPLGRRRRRAPDARAPEYRDEVVERVARRPREQARRGRRLLEHLRRREPRRRAVRRRLVVKVEQVLRLLPERDRLQRLLRREAVVGGAAKEKTRTGTSSAQSLGSSGPLRKEGRKGGGGGGGGWANRRRRIRTLCLCVASSPRRRAPARRTSPRACGRRSRGSRSPRGARSAAPAPRSCAGAILAAGAPARQTAKWALRQQRERDRAGSARGQRTFAAPGSDDSRRQ